MSHKPKTVRTSRLVFSTPGDWIVTRSAQQVAASPKLRAAELVSVSVFRLVHPYRPALFAKVVPEIDRAARDLATGLRGTIQASRTVVLVGIRSRQYDFAYKTDGQDFRQRITFVLRARVEYQLLCRWKASEKEPTACSLLERTFAPL